MAVIELDGSATLIVSEPVVVPAAILSAEHETPGTVWLQVTETAAEKPPQGVIVIAEVPDAVEPPAEVVADAAPPEIVNEPGLPPVMVNVTAGEATALKLASPL